MRSLPRWSRCWAPTQSGLINILSPERIADLAGLEGPSREDLVHAAVRELNLRGQMVCTEPTRKQHGKLADEYTPYCHGQCGCDVPGAATILIRPGMDGSLEAYVSIHEIIHAVVKQLVPSCDKETEERVIEQLADAVCLSFLPTDRWPLGTALGAARGQGVANNN